MAKAKQLSFIKDPRKNTKLWWIEKQKTYGGSLNYRKVERPFVPNGLNHVVLKARLGGGVWFTRSQRSIEKLLRRSAQQYGIKIQEFAINKDHIHLLVWGKRRENFLCFLRFFTSEMGRKYKRIFAEFGVRTARPLWVGRPFSRIVSWGKRALKVATEYLKKNRDEAMGFVPYTPRKHRLNAFLTAWTQQVPLNSA